LPSVERHGSPRVFVVDNVDPDEVAGLYEHLDLDTTLFNVVSKSGTTAETMAAYLVAHRLVEQSVGRIRLPEHFVFTTDPYGGVLREIAHAEGIRTFSIPTGVGGRFSVLSPVGLVPAAIAGIDVRGLLEGARAMQEWIAEADVVSNPAYLYATMLYLQHTRYHRMIDVMMPYSRRLEKVGDWFRQLWAESLGKAVSRSGETIHAGLTPVDALGATDQHSQIQLYTEGPDDKVITFLRVEEFTHEVPLPAQPGVDALAYLGGRSMAELINAEQEATAWALARRGRPSMTITLPRVEASTLGQLLYLLQVATAVAGEFYDVDAYDQPGVELGKRATYALMGRPGFHELAKEIRPSEEGESHRYLLA
jgi:glucose-6-phosphate isomerase